MNGTCAAAGRPHTNTGGQRYTLFYQIHNTCQPCSKPPGLGCMQCEGWRGCSVLRWTAGPLTHAPQVMEGINLVRTTPGSLIPKLQKRLGRFENGGKVYKTKELSICTMEGMGGWQGQLGRVVGSWESGNHTF